MYMGEYIMCIIMHVCVYVIYISHCIYYSYYLIPHPSIGQVFENSIDDSFITKFVYKLNSLPRFFIRCYISVHVATHTHVYIYNALYVNGGYVWVLVLIK